MPTIVKTPSGTWKTVIRKTGWPTVIKTFRLKKDAEDWGRRTEDDMVRGLFIQRAPSERLTLDAAMKRYLAEVTPNKRPLTQRGELRCSLPLIKFFGKYSLAAISSELVAKYRDMRLAGEDRIKDGKPQPRAPNTVRLELSLLGHLFTVAMKEWGIGLPHNPVLGIRKPAPGAGRNRRLSEAEEKKLFDAVDAHTNPMLGWIVESRAQLSQHSRRILGHWFKEELA